MESSGKRPRFRLTCSFNLLVGTSYNSAKSRSNKTFLTTNQENGFFNPLGRYQGIFCHIYTPQL